MEGIICPYHWDCGKKIEPTEFSTSDHDFLQSATAKKMTFMIIHCPKCSREFKFDTVQWKSDGCGYSDPNVIIKKKKKTTKQLIAVLDKAKVEIPTLYFDYITSSAFDPQVSIFPDEEAFDLYDLEQLCEKIKVDGTSCLTVSQLRGFANTLLDIMGKIPPKKQDLSTQDLSNCLTIGFGNTRLLFIDCRDNNTLWVFYPDGGDVEKLQITLENIVKGECVQERSNMNSNF